MPDKREVDEALEYAARPDRYALPAWWVDKRLDAHAAEVLRLRESEAALKAEREVSNRTEAPKDK